MGGAYASTSRTTDVTEAEESAAAEPGADAVAARPRKAAKAQLRVGRLVKAHGLKGGLKVELYTDDPKGRFTPGATFTLQVPESSPWHGKPLTVREFRFMNSHAVAFFEGVDDRSAAEELLRAILWIDEDAATAPAEDDAWYDHQLVGLDVVRDDEVVGRVIRVDHFPAQDLLIVRTLASAAGGDREVLVPFVKAIVPEVDVPGRPGRRDAASRPVRGPSGRRRAGIRRRSRGRRRDRRVRGVAARRAVQPIGAMRTTAFLNSGIDEIGSSASLVSRLALAASP